MANFAKCIHSVMRPGVSGDVRQQRRARAGGTASHPDLWNQQDEEQNQVWQDREKAKGRQNILPSLIYNVCYRKQSQTLTTIPGIGACRGPLVWPACAGEQLS